MASCFVSRINGTLTFRVTTIHTGERCGLLTFNTCSPECAHVNEGTSAVLSTPPGKPLAVHDKMNRKPGKIPMIIFGIVLVGGIGWAASQLLGDLFAVQHATSVTAYALLIVALLIALGF